MCLVGITDYVYCSWIRVLCGTIDVLKVFDAHSTLILLGSMYLCYEIRIYVYVCVCVGSNGHNPPS